MPIIPKSVADARRAAAAAAAAAKNNEPSPSVEAAIVAGLPKALLDAEPSGAEFLQTPAKRPSKRRGHAVRDENGKWQPTAPYSSGFARPPEEHKFKPGGKAGPGRPKGSVSHDALLAKHLNQKREVSLNGQRQRLSTRELLVIQMLKAAMEGKDRHARAYLLSQVERLFPSKDEANDNAASSSNITASDMLSLAEYEAELRDRLREEIRSEFGASEGEGR